MGLFIFKSVFRGQSLNFFISAFKSVNHLFPMVQLFQANSDYHHHFPRRCEEYGKTEQGVMRHQSNKLIHSCCVEIII